MNLRYDSARIQNEAHTPNAKKNWSMEEWHQQRDIFQILSSKLPRDDNLYFFNILNRVCYLTHNIFYNIKVIGIKW